MNHRQGEKLPRCFFAFVRMNACLTAIVTLMNVFLNNFFLDTSGGDLSTVLLYNLILALVQPVAMVLTVVIARRKNPIFSQRIGFLVYAATFVWLLIAGESAGQFGYVIGAFLAVGAGFYYVTYSLQIVAYTDDGNRDRATGVMNTVGAVVSILLPLFAGYLTDALSGFLGYRILFGAMLLIAALGIWFGARLAPLQSFDGDKKTHFRAVAHTLLHGKNGRVVMGISALVGIRSGTMTFFISVLLYRYLTLNTDAGAGALVGWNNALGYAAALLSAGAYGFFIRPNRRSRSIILGATITMLSAIPLFFGMNAWTLIVFNFVNNFFGIFISEPQTNVYFGVLQTTQGLQGRGAEVHTVREFFYGAGRAVGVALTLLLMQSERGQVIAILLLTATQILSAYLIGRVKIAADVPSDEIPERV